MSKNKEKTTRLGAKPTPSCRLWVVCRSRAGSPALFTRAAVFKEHEESTVLSENIQLHCMIEREREKERDRERERERERESIVI